MALKPFDLQPTSQLLEGAGIDAQSVVYGSHCKNARGVVQNGKQPSQFRKLLHRFQELQ